MSKLNTAVASSPVLTHEGAVAKRINPTLQLRRTVMACMLWESEFYESGESIAARIMEAIKRVPAQAAAQIAIEAREKMKLRHVPLLIVREMARLPTHRALVADTLARVIQRPDELSEFLAIYWKDNKDQSLSAQVKKGLARAFTKFDEFSLAKYNRDGEIKLRDVLFLCHAKPLDAEQAAVWKRLIDGTLPVPDTWEVAISAAPAAEKAATWSRLLQEGKLGALALLRNLRNLTENKVSMQAIQQALSVMKTERVLPYRFIAAARHAVNLEPQLEQAMFKCLAGVEKLPGRTVLMVDISGSMDEKMSGKSDLRRVDAACGLAMLLREICEDVAVFTFSDNLAEIPPRRGFALRDAIINSQNHGSTQLGAAVRHVLAHAQLDRLIVISDEQSADTVPDPKCLAYMLNVASATNGVGYGPWTHIDGFSEACVDYIKTLEKNSAE